MEDHDSEEPSSPDSETSYDPEEELETVAELGALDRILKKPVEQPENEDSPSDEENAEAEVPSP
jgi:hypothetical protein